MNIMSWISSGEKLEVSGTRNAGLTIVVAVCSIIYELVYAEALKATFGNQVARYAITIGLYLLCLGIGAMLYGKLKGVGSAKAFLSVEMMLCLVGPLGFFFIIWVSSTPIFNLNDPSDYLIALILAHIPIIIVGLLSGMELPILADMNQDEAGFSKTLGWDYVGSLIGTILYALWVFPNYGLTVSAISTGALNLMAAIVFIGLFPKKSPKSIVALAFTAVLAYAASIVNIDYIDSTIRKIYYSNLVNDSYSNDTEIYVYAEVTEYHKTKYQNVIFYDLAYAGQEKVDRCMNLDKHAQLCTSWVETYHRGLIDVPMALVEKEEPEVLLIGGGDWIPVRKLIPYEAKIDHVDIDKEFTELTKEHPLIAPIHKGAYKYNKLNTIHTDGFSYVRENVKKYDLIVIDLPGLLTDKLLHLYSEEFFYFLKKGLADSGYLVNWTYSPEGQKNHRGILLSSLKKAGFEEILDYQVFDDNGLGGEHFYLLKGGGSLEESDRTESRINNILVGSPGTNSYRWKYIGGGGYRSNSIFHPNMNMVVKKVKMI